MSDIVERLTNYHPKNEWGDKVHHTICTEAAGEISGLRIDLAAKETEALGYLRAVGELQGRIAELEKALEGAYLAGFKASAEGWNGEHGPYPPEEDSTFIRNRDEFLRSIEAPDK